MTDYDWAYVFRIAHDLAEEEKIKTYVWKQTSFHGSPVAPRWVWSWRPKDRTQQ